MQASLFFPEYGYEQIARHTEVAEHIVNRHALTFDAVAATAMVQAGLAKADSANVPVISSEMLSGNPLMGGVGSIEFADRLKQIVPNARILIAVRNQMTMLPSVYMQYLLRGGTMTPAQFFSRREDADLGFGYYPYNFAPEHFEYDRLVKYYHDSFGADRVHVFTQEQLAKDPAKTLSLVATFSGNTAFAGVRPNEKRRGVSYPEYAVPFLRRINHVQRGTFNANPIIRLGTTPGGLYRGVGYVLKRPPFTSLLGGRKPVTAVVKQMFSGYYDQSNERLDDLLQSQTGWSGLPWK